MEHVFFIKGLVKVIVKHHREHYFI